MAKKAKKVFAIPPEEYSEILKGMDFRSITLISCSSKYNADKMDVPLSITIKDEGSFNHVDSDLVEVKHSYSLYASAPKKKTNAIIVKCTYTLLFSTKKEFKQDFFDVFKEFNLPLNTWPYFRELAQNLTQRMNIPPLTLPFWKV